MAERFLELLPGHDMIKFAKNGSTATTAAVKLARAFTGREWIAFPKDHPFYSYDDWFIGSTHCSKGVPQSFQPLSVTYDSKDLSTLEELFKSNPGRIACVISEPEKPEGISAGYLQQLIDISHRGGALFILDEMVTGFKTDFPGSMKKHNVIPDMATWGKGIANGFSFCALTGKREIMELGGIQREGEEKVFLISTTHGGETHAMAACLATIDVFKKEGVLKHNHSIGIDFTKMISEVIQTQNLNSHIQANCSEWMSVFVFKNSKGEISPGLRTLVMQEMIKRGVLFQGAFVPCFSHTTKDIVFFAEAFAESLKVYSSALEQGYEKFLVGTPAKPVFRKHI